MASPSHDTREGRRQLVNANRHLPGFRMESPASTGTDRMRFLADRMKVTSRR
jgi:hypothetical protein